MVFVTVGNAPQEFQRLLEAVDRLAGDGAFGDLPVFMQIGNSHTVRPVHCAYKSFVTRDEFQGYLDAASLVICHGGATVLQTIRIGKIPIVMPRQKKYGEHVNDHQVEFVRALAAEGRALLVLEPEDLPYAIFKASQLKSRLIPDTSSQMCTLVARAITDLVEHRKSGWYIRRAPSA